MKGEVRRFVVVGLGLALAVLSCVPPRTAIREGVELVFFDVGQGDATLVRSPEGKVALIDGGRGVDMVALLERHGVDSIDLIMASHAHADHIGGLERVIRTVPVRYYMDSGLAHTTSTYINLMRALRGSDITYLEATARTIDLGSVVLRILPPPGWEDQNNNSVGVVVEYGAFKALLTGDSEVAELDYFLSLGVPDLTVLKAPHHGSDDAVTSDWLSVTRPEVVVISAGLDNPYGHPHGEALSYYESAADVYRTDRDGEVTVRGWRDGEFEVVTQRGPHFGD